MTWSAFFSALKAGGVAVRSAPATSSTGRRGGQVANQAVNSDAGITRSTSTQAQTAAKPTPREEEAMDNWEFMVLDEIGEPCVYQEEQQHPTMTWSAFYSAHKNNGGSTGSASAHAQSAAKSSTPREEDTMDNWEFMVIDEFGEPCVPPFLPWFGGLVY